MAVVELGKRSRVPELGAVAEHRRSHGKPPRLGRQAREPKRHCARNGFGPELAHPPGILGSGWEALTVHRVQDRPKEERVASRRSVTRGDECIFRVDPELLSRQ